MKNYLCSKCSVLITSGSKPSSLGCPKGSMHDWKDLGEVGADNYLCRKCSTQVKSRSKPSSLKCPAGSMHDWRKL